MRTKQEIEDKIEYLETRIRLLDSVPSLDNRLERSCLLARVAQLRWVLKEID